MKTTLGCLKLPVINGTSCLPGPLKGRDLSLNLGFIAEHQAAGKPAITISANGSRARGAFSRFCKTSFSR